MWWFLNFFLLFDNKALLLINWEEEEEEEEELTCAVLADLNAEATTERWRRHVSPWVLSRLKLSG